MRKDAEANRRNLVLAGRKLMQDLGGAVSVEQICAAAGVTRGTFYRNFADRGLLYAAVLDHELEHLSAELDRPGLDALAFMRLLAEMMMVFDRFMANLPDMSDFPKDGVSEAKILAVIAPSLDTARRAGRIRAGVSGEDILIVCRMVASDWRLDRAPSREAALDKRFALVVGGISDTDRSDMA